MAKDVAIRIEGLRDLRRALRNIPPELKRDLRDASAEIAREGARDIAAAARTPGERKAAKSVRARRQREPVIAAGGGGRTEGGPMFFGTEFGGRGRATTQQFPPHRGREGYFFYPTVRARGRDWVEHWLDAIDAVTARHWRNR